MKEENSVEFRELIRCGYEYVGTRRNAEGGLESLLFEVTNRWMTYQEAIEFCIKNDIRLPLLDDLRCVYKNGYARYFDNKSYWSNSNVDSSEMPAKYAFDFKDGEVHKEPHSSKLFLATIRILRE